MDKRARLKFLRKKKRLAELRAKKAGSSTPSSGDSSFLDSAASAVETGRDFLAGMRDNIPVVSDAMGKLGSAAQVPMEAVADYFGGGIYDNEGVLDTYNKAEEARARTEAESAERSPTANMAGGLASGFILPGGGVKAAAATGGAIGGYEAANEADWSDPLQAAQDVAIDTGIGAAGGALLGKAGEKAGDLASGGLDKIANSQFLKSLKPMKRAQGDLRKLGVEDEVGEKIGEAVGMNPFRTNQGISDRLGQSRTAANDKIDEMYRGLEDSGVEKSKIAQYFVARADEMMADPDR